MTIVARRWLFGVLFLIACPVLGRSAEDKKVERFRAEIEPILERYCLDCHGNGFKKGDVELDAFDSDESVTRNRDLWRAVLRNVRAGIMPPPKKPRPTAEEIQTLADWIKRDAFDLDPNDPDPGRVTVRRLNRVEYRRTIKDLMGIDYNTVEEFPPDDTGYGFDTIGDVLNVSPLLLEKYAQAAETIVTKAVPTVSKQVRETTILGGARDESREESRKRERAAERHSFYQVAKIDRAATIDKAGDYRIGLELQVLASFDFDPGRCKVIFRDGDEELLSHEFAWGERKKSDFEFERKQWSIGEHRLSIEIQPLVPIDKKKQPLDLRVDAIRVIGPLDKESWVHPPNYERFFFNDEPPATDPERAEYAREILKRFALKAFRRPIADSTLERFAAFAEKTYRQPGKTFEEGIARAVVVMLASPRFLFRIEGEQPGDRPGGYPFVDEYALASRLSYFLWSTMPDDELFDLAARGELRKNLRAQVKRMLTDPRSAALVENFAGQWLQLRDVEGVQISAREVLKREGSPSRFRFFLDPELRRAMRRETELCFERVLREDRSILEWIDADYTYLNARLAKYYGIEGVTGEELHPVQLPKDSPRGGILTQGSILIVTSNPTRTSPVKRGLFILENLMGSPPPPPPPDIPTLEESEKEFKGAEPTMRQIMEIHRAKPLCNACHSRMDPLGLALENFNALGLYREKERGKAIEATGVLISGEPFQDVRDLKKIITHEHRADYYRCVAEKLLTYAIGRGVETNDVESVDRIVESLERSQGRFESLLLGVVESAPFQKRRGGSINPHASRAPESLVPSPHPLSARRKP